MPLHQRLLYLFAITILTCTLFTITVVAADPWYVDLHNHWAKPYIHVLWEEDVTDGYVSRHVFYWLNRARFRPSDQITRGQWGMLACKAFDIQPQTTNPGVIDVPSYHVEYVDKPAANYLYAAAAHRMLPISGAYFQPQHHITREDAVSGLISALNLDQFIPYLSPADIDTAVCRFKDSRLITPSLKPQIALAVMLGIIEGYPDSTLRPRNPLTRAEAATILFRCCLIRVNAEPNPFSPDNDGIDDITTFQPESMNNRQATVWTIRVTTFTNTNLFTSSALYRQGKLPDISWNGQNVDGQVVADGLYLYQAEVRDQARNRFWSVKKPLWISTRTLSGRLTPVYVTPGSEMRISAETTGGALSVVGYDVSTGNVCSLEPVLDTAVDHNSWEVRVPVGNDLVQGQHELELTADFGVTTRLLSLSYYLIDRYAVTAKVEPDQCQPGDPVVVTAITVGTAQSVTGVGPWGEFVMTWVDNQWLYEGEVGMECEQGVYPVEVVAVFTGGVERDMVWLRVGEMATLSDLRFVLTD